MELKVKLLKDTGKVKKGTIMLLSDEEGHNAIALGMAEAAQELTNKDIKIIEKYKSKYESKIPRIKKVVKEEITETKDTPLNKIGWLSELYYEIGKQQTNFRLTHTYKKEGATLFTKWVKYLDAQSNDKIINAADQREQLKNEIIFDKDKGNFEELIKTLREDGIKFYAYSTEEGRARQIHTYWEGLSILKKNEREEVRRLLIKKYDCDLAFRIDAHVIPIEFENHWKTGKIKNLIDKEEGINNAEPIIILLEKEKPKKELSILTRRGQIEEFWNTKPFYYDKSKIFYLWNNKLFKWEISDEVDFCNSIYSILGMDTINRTNKGEIVEAFKQVGRMHKPKDMEKSWVQFKDRIYDIKTGDDFEATPEYFVTNPIPYKVGATEETPIIDGYFTDWMKGQDKSWKETLYEIMAYNICRDKFMQRIIGLCGGGSNGKGTYAKLNEKLLGKENCVASEIKNLSEDKFEPATLYQKLLCIMGEVYYDDLKNTNILKKLGGEDRMSFQFKGKTPFTEDNTATCMCLTNSMPITPDKTTGFYRKWLIIDFLNEFKEVDKNIIDNIPEEEFENLSKKLLRIIKELYVNPHFTNEGNFEERAKRYEEHSNPVMKFVEDECIEKAGEMVSLREFTNECNTYLNTNKLRVMTSKQIGGVLRNESFIVGNRKIDDISAVVIVNLTLKTIKTIKTIVNPNRELYKRTNTDLDSFDSNDSSEPITETETIEETHNSKGEDTIIPTQPSTTFILNAVKDKGKQGYPIDQFIDKYSESRLNKLLEEGELFMYKPTIIKVL